MTSVRLQPATVLLTAGTLVAAVLSIVAEPAPSGSSSQEIARLQIEGTGRLRAAYGLRSRLGMLSDTPIALGPELSGINHLTRLAKLRKTPDNLRRLAIARFIMGDANWRQPLLELRALPDFSPSQADRELAAWNVAFGRADVAPEDCRSASRLLQSLKLGWYEHVALAALYDKCGRSREAWQQREAAYRTTDYLMAMAALTLVAGLAGCGVLAVLVAYWISQRRANLPIVRLAPLPIVAGQVLMYAAAAYFGFLTLLRLLVPLMAQALQSAAGDEQASIVYRSILNLLVVALSVAIPSAVLRGLGRRVGLTSSDLGIARPKLLRDVGGGVTGYVATLPLLALSLVVSTALFDPSASRMNPAALDFARAQTFAARAVLFALGAVAAPFVEEFVFRGLLLRALQPRLGFGRACVTTAALFAILHPQLPTGFLSIFTLGVAFALLYGLTGSLWPAVLAHGINNSIVFLYLALYLGG